MRCYHLHLTQYVYSVKVPGTGGRLRKTRSINQWSWEIKGRTRYSYHTNNCGEGIFEYDSKTCETRQLTGTCQFTIAGYTASGARAKINRWIEQHMMED